MSRLFETTLDRFGRLDIVVANAGLEMVDQPVLEFTESDFDRLFAINAKGTFFTLQLAARHVVDNGRIIYVGTSNTAHPLPGHALYGGSKAAGQFLVGVLAKEIGHRGVTVNAEPWRRADHGLSDRAGIIGDHDDRSPDAPAGRRRAHHAGRLARLLPHHPGDQV